MTILHCDNGHLHFFETVLTIHNLVTFFITRLHFVDDNNA